MKILNYEYKVEYFNSNVFSNYFGNMNMCVFDIETLGLSPQNKQVVLCGILSVDKSGNATAKQFFLEHLDEESELLSCVQTELNKYDYILTYNGKHFDIPFVLKRAELLNLKNFTISPYNLDLYLIINGCNKLKHFLKDLKQKSIEEYMGLSTNRKDEISGKESVELYYKYLSEKDIHQKEEICKLILLHNHDDIVQLYRLLPIVRNLDIHKGLYKLGFPIKSFSSNIIAKVSKITLNGKFLSIIGNYTGEPFSCQFMNTDVKPYDVFFYKDGTFKFVIPVQNYKGNTFINVKEIFANNSEYTFFQKYPNYVNGFLILSDMQTKNFLEINMFAKKIIEKFIKENEI